LYFQNCCVLNLLFPANHLIHSRLLVLFFQLYFFSLKNQVFSLIR